jgi:hypothetical protein
MLFGCGDAALRKDAHISPKRTTERATLGRSRFVEKIPKTGKLTELIFDRWRTIVVCRMIEWRNAEESGGSNREGQRYIYNQRNVVGQAVMLIGKKTGQAELLAAIKGWRLVGKLRKSEIAAAFALPIVPMRKIGGDVGNEQERSKKQRRSFSEAWWHFTYNEFNGKFC